MSVPSIPTHPVIGFEGRALSGRKAAFDPTQVPGLETWLDANTLGLANGAAVSSWTDRSGNGNHATQAIVASQPLFVTGGTLSGEPVVRFDGTDDSLALAGILNNSAARSIYFVAKKVNTSGNLRMLGWSLSAWARQDVGQFQWNSTSLGAHTFTNWNVFGLRFNSTASLDGTVNAGAATNMNPGTGHSSGTTSLKLANVDGANLWGGDWSQLLVWNRAVMADEHTKIVNYLMTRVGI